MKYYKIIVENKIIAAATSDDFKFAIKNNKLIACSEDKGQYLFIDSKLYHAEWMNALTYQIPYIFANVQAITEPEYKILYDTLYDKKEIIEVEEPDNNEDYVAPPINIPEYQNLDAEQLLAFVQERKLQELSHICNQTIESGVDVGMLDGQIHHFSLTTQDQLNLISLQAMIDQGMEQIPYHADGELCKFYTPVEIKMIISEATKWKTYHTTYYNALKNYVNSLDDPYVIANITYGIELPEEYQSDVLKALNA